MKRIVFNHPVISLFIVLVIAFAFAFIFFVEQFHPIFLYKTVAAIGATKSMVLIGLFIVLLGLLVAYLFKNNHFTIVLFSIVLTIEISYGVYLVNQVIQERIHDYIQLSAGENHVFLDEEGRLISDLMKSFGISIVSLLWMAMVLVFWMQYANRRIRKEMRDRLVAEKEKKQMRKAMMQSQKLEAVGTLAGGIAHNFNNILYAIKGYTELSRQDVSPDTVTYANLGKVLDASQRGQELVNGILSFSRKDSSGFQTIVMRKVVEDSVGLLKSTLPASIELQVDIEIEDEKVRGSLTQLQQVLINLIRNAADAMDSRGKIELSVEQLNDAAYLKTLHPGLTYPSYFQVKITDHGPGMSKTTRERIFEPFFTTKDIDKGTGLGLATARSIIDEHGGEIIVQSEVGRGSCFIVLIPTCAASGKTITQ